MDDKITNFENLENGTQNMGVKRSGTNIPKFLYKYRQCNKRSFDNLRDGVVWCGTLNNYNDPYEGYTTVHFLPVYKAFLNRETFDHFRNELDQIDNLDELVEFATSELNFSSTEIEQQITMQREHLEELHREFRDRNIQNTAICSFAENCDNRLMWSHYTNYYTGFCIGYKTEQMRNFLHRVEYNNEIFDITNDLIEIMQSANNPGFDTENFEPNRMVIRKDNIWEYEKEWRLINPIERNNMDDNNGGYTYPLTPSIIYLGTRISDDNRNRLLKIAENQNLTVNQIDMDENRYQLLYKTIYKPNKEDNK